MENDSQELILQNNDKWKEILAFNPSIGSKRKLVRNDNIVKVNGVYIIDNRGFVMFYRQKGKLFLNSCGKEYCLDDYNCNVYHERKGIVNEFRIEISGIPVFSQNYQSWRYDPLNQFDLDFNEDMEENQDFYLFVYNVMKNNERRQRIYNV